jgi:hypothetical protein
VVKTECNQEIDMLNYVIYTSMGILSSALMVSFIKIRNIVKNGDPDLIRASLFLRYGVFKRTTLFIIDGMTFIFFVQIINMLFGLQYLTIFYHQVMSIASLICLIVIGYSFIHLNQTVTFKSYNPARNELERWIYGDDRR